MILAVIFVQNPICSKPLVLLTGLFIYSFIYFSILKVPSQAEQVCSWPGVGHVTLTADIATLAIA